MDLALNNKRWLICHKNQPTNQPTNKNNFPPTILIHINAILLSFFSKNCAIQILAKYIYICSTFTRIPTVYCGRKQSSYKLH